MGLARFAAVLFAFASLLPASARADESDDARSQALFREGREALERNDLSVACDRFGESVRLAPRAAGPLLNLAECEERLGHLVIARRRWADASAQLDAGDPRAAVARTRGASLERRIPRLTVELDQAAAASQATLDLDGRALASPPRELEIDPGRHVISLVAPGREPQRKTFEAVESRTVKLRLELGAQSGPPPAGSRTPAFVAAGVGLAGLGVFAVTGAVMGGLHATVDEHCSLQTQHCDPEGASAASQGRTLTVVNAVALGVAGAGAAVAVVLFATRGSRGPNTNAALRASPERAQLAVGGAF